MIPLLGIAVLAVLDPALVEAFNAREAGQPPPAVVWDDAVMASPAPADLEYERMLAAIDGARADSLPALRASVHRFAAENANDARVWNLRWELAGALARSGASDDARAELAALRPLDEPRRVRLELALATVSRAPGERTRHIERAVDAISRQHRRDGGRLVLVGTDAEAMFLDSGRDVWVLAQSESQLEWAAVVAFAELLPARMRNAPRFGTVLALAVAYADGDSGEIADVIAREDDVAEARVLAAALIARMGAFGLAELSERMEQGDFFARDLAMRVLHR